VIEAHEITETNDGFNGSIGKIPRAQVPALGAWQNQPCARMAYLTEYGDDGEKYLSYSTLASCTRAGDVGLLPPSCTTSRVEPWLP
jgi:hypothetical protein